MAHWMGCAPTLAACSNATRLLVTLVHATSPRSKVRPRINIDGPSTPTNDVIDLALAWRAWHAKHKRGMEWLSKGGCGTTGRA